jgi:hypothetical protein
VEIVKQLAAKLQIQLAAKLRDPLADLLGLCEKIFFIVKANAIHMPTLLFRLPSGKYKNTHISYHNLRQRARGFAKNQTKFNEKRKGHEAPFRMLLLSGDYLS